MGIGITGVMQATKEQLSWLDPCYQHLRDFDKRYSELNGFNRSIKLTTCKPSGCNKGDTLVVSDVGILNLNELGDTSGERWQELGIQISQENKETEATKFFLNGLAKTKKIKLDSGIDIECTPSHQYRVLEEGRYIWKTADTLKKGDQLVYRVGGYNGGSYQTLEKAELNYHTNSVPITQPDILNEDLAYFLGCYFADGSTHKKGIRIAGNNSSKLENLHHLKNIILDQLDYEGKIYERPGTKNVDLYFTSQPMLRWLTANNLIKPKAEDANIPLIVRMSPASVVKAFIEGYFSGDGHLHGDTMVFTTVSKTLAQQLPVVMRAIGIDAKVREMPPTESSYGNRMRYSISERKGRLADKKYIKGYIKTAWDELDKLQYNECGVDLVEAVSDGECETFDIEVPEDNTYLANSYVSHNTLSLLPGVTPGVHPGYAQYMFRRIRIAANHELVAVCKSHGYPVEFVKNFDGSEDYGTVVVTFPFSYPETAKLAKDTTALDQLNMVREIQSKWSDNSVSCTVYYKPEELPAIKEHLLKHYKNNYKTLSFLLHSEHGFMQAPYQEINQQSYELLVENTKIIESIDSVDFDSNDECASGHCPVK
jgi:intein/homing endonuclease